nr:MAG TPA: hypothetical protein [Caudoviricetes sp.]
MSLALGDKPESVPVSLECLQGQRQTRECP